MKNHNSYLPHTASKIVKTMTLPCAMCCSHCRMTLGSANCHVAPSHATAMCCSHCHMALNALPPPCGKKKLQPRLQVSVLPYFGNQSVVFIFCMT